MFASRRTPKLRCEPLDDRALPAVVLPPYIPVDVSQVAALYPRHAGATNVYLNFDGWSDRAVAAFEGTTGDWNRDVNEILFRAAELFAPFDVQVRRIHGNGNRSLGNGDTTVFVGDKLGNTDWYELPGGGWSLVNDDYAYAESIDGPTAGNGLKTPNSNGYDVAFVDPVSYTASSAGGGQPVGFQTYSNGSIARTVGHEAGHTFGLGHVLSGGDPAMMNYGVSNLRFMNASHPITVNNNNGSAVVPVPSFQPIWAWNPPGPVALQPVAVPLQNSYAYLRAALGERPVDYANVANVDSTDPAYNDGIMPAVAWNGGGATASVTRVGDYDVFTTSSPSTRWLEVTVNTPGSSLDPVVFVTDGAGRTALAFDDDSGPGTDSRVVFRATAGTVYKIAVGGWNGNTTGEYELGVSEFNPEVNPDVLPPDLGLSGGPPKMFAGPAVRADIGLAAAGGADAARWKIDFTLPPPDAPGVVPPVGPTDFAPPPVIPGSVSFAGGVVSIVGTNANDQAAVRYVVAPGGAVSVAPTPWIRVELDTPLGDFVNFFPTALVSKVTFDGKLGNDAFQNATLVPSVAEGGPGDDVLITGNGNDIARGGDGNDLVAGLGGADYLEGNGGHDHLFGGTGTDHLLGDEVGQVGDDVLFGEDGDDALEGRGGADVLFGGTGRDVLIGGEGADDLDGGPGDDLLVGGRLAFPILGPAVGAIALEWSSPHPYDERVRNLRGIPHPTFAARLNGGTFLVKGATVIDDGDADNLLGGVGQDFFVVGPFDATDAAFGEQAY